MVVEGMGLEEFLRTMQLRQENKLLHSENYVEPTHTGNKRRINKSAMDNLPQSLRNLPGVADAAGGMVAGAGVREQQAYHPLRTYA